MEYFSKELIKEKREEERLTQRQLAELLFVSEKTVSKWETGRGLPDVSFLPALAGALGLSVAELMSGKQRLNANRSANVLKGKFYVCPICGNVLFSLGELSASCCGVGLIAESAAQDYVQFGKILSFSFPDSDFRRRLYIVKHKNSILSPIAQVFYDYARKTGDKASAQ